MLNYSYMDTGSQKHGRGVIMPTYSRATVYFKKVFGKYTLEVRLTKFFCCRGLFFSENLTDPHNCAVNTRLLKIKSD
jgi:hypothetical protein